MSIESRFAEFGPNVGLVDELYRQYLEDPSSVGESWREFFADYTPRSEQRASSSAPIAMDGETASPIRGVGARVVENMEASLGVPTATSVRAVPAKLLEVNRQILNNHLSRIGGGKVSFTHMIAFAVLRALRSVPAMNASFGVVDGTPSLARHQHVNLGLAIDVKKADGTRSLLVPNIKGADTLNFAAFHAAYEDLIRRVRANKITPADFAETTVTITNPGMIGTVHSVPRLMPGQGVIIGVGAIDFPAEYQGADPSVLAQVGVSKVTTLTSTYDHRIIGGAESGEFLRQIHQLLLGADGFYDELFAAFAVPYEPARWSVDSFNSEAGSLEHHEKVVQVHQLINLYRVRGHLMANLDPLGQDDPHTHTELDINAHGLSIWDLDRTFPTGGLGEHRSMRLRDILGLLRDAYARTIGIEYMHIQDPEQKQWIQERVEGVHHETDVETKRRILERLNAAEAFERFLHTKYLGHKRFSLEGAESLIPMLDSLLSDAANAGATEAVLGMAHRGRLNVLANVLSKSYSTIFREFEGELDPRSTQGSGDVRYHLGAHGNHTAPSGAALELTLSSNPSHLEAVDPVVAGMARAKDDLIGDPRHDSVIPILIHGDAAFAGQGVVAETFNLAEVSGYGVGGTVHIVVNNQLGFTTSPSAGRSGVYCTDVAKMVQAPIFHVNGDDPEACVRVIQLAFAFRQAFHKDVVVDMVCYRRYGHNEGDEPGFTQPKMYAAINGRRSVRKLYTETLVNRGDLTLAEAEAALDDFKARLEVAFEETKQSHAPTGEHRAIPISIGEDVSTAISTTTLDRLITTITTWPEDFRIHPKLERIITARKTDFDAGTIDWATAEALALGSLVDEDTMVRIAGQDTRRGTFSQRHSVLIDHESEAEYTPLSHVREGQAPFMIFDSVLSEYAALGFEYGYSVANPDAFVAWEAQFGDFVNGAQIILDQFVVAALDKWDQDSRLALLLPHGFEGQGPEHSSARIERFLTLAAEDNIRVVYPSTSAQYFHALRRQVRSEVRRPLVCITPKKYLRMPHTKSPVSAFSDGQFELVLDDRNAMDADRGAVKRVLLCTGKIAHELMDKRDELGAPVAVVRVEQIAPWPLQQLEAILDRYPNVEHVVWVQEEPENMGAWTFVHERLHRVIRTRAGHLHHISRAASASPASGSQTIHDREQADLLTAAFADL
ncbi:MAG: multifunctional oxoglutarate decarboxylase/oxoglutarate dehydrogenase thiamine pyrophosphate-binding subunit/dihydrolipoyllysine-residue succinyltransferase subunit [Acidimicrobiia bacterium]